MCHQGSDGAQSRTRLEMPFPSDFFQSSYTGHCIHVVLLLRSEYCRCENEPARESSGSEDSKRHSRIPCAKAVHDPEDGEDGTSTDVSSLCSSNIRISLGRRRAKHEDVTRWLFDMMLDSVLTVLLGLALIAKNQEEERREENKVLEGSQQVLVQYARLIQVI